MSRLHLKANPTLTDLQQYAREMAAERSFNDTVEQKFMLLIEEVGELAKASRKHAGLGYAADSHDQDVEGEAADVLLILLGLCNLLNIDLEQALRTKEEKNKQRVWK